jgi:hypothetical protein
MSAAHSKWKPVAWIGPKNQLMLDAIYKAWEPSYPDEAKEYRPLYAAEAECDALREDAERWRWTVQNPWHACMILRERFYASETIATTNAAIDVERKK